jgi:hypothetical protein
MKHTEIVIETLRAWLFQRRRKFDVPPKRSRLWTTLRRLTPVTTPSYASERVNPETSAFQQRRKNDVQIQEITNRIDRVLNSSSRRHGCVCRTLAAREWNKQRSNCSNSKW